MANCCVFDGRCILPKSKLNKFLAYFDSDNHEVDRHISRTAFFVDYSEEREDDLIYIEFDGECDWSCLCCWVEIPMDAKIIPLINVLKDCEVEYFVGRSDEPGIGFYEFFKYTKDDEEIEIQCFDLP